MITLEELNNDPWGTYPVNKDELRELIFYRDIYTKYDNIDPYHMQVHYVRENTDGSADIEFTVGREVAREFIRRGFLSAITEIAQQTVSNPCSNEDGDEMCDKCNCWKHTRSMCG